MDLPPYPSATTPPPTLVTYPRSLNLLDRIDPVRGFQCVLWMSVGLCLLLAIQGLQLLLFMRQPPAVVEQFEDGSLVWRETSEYFLTYRNIQDFLDKKLTRMFSRTPGACDLSDLTGEVSEKNILKALENTSELRLASNQRRQFRLLGFRESPDPEHPEMLCYLVHGENYLLEFNAAASEPFRTREGTHYFLVWLERRQPSKDCPSGLFMSYLEDIDNEVRGAELWQSTTPVQVDGTEQGDRK